MLEDGGGERESFITLLGSQRSGTETGGRDGAALAKKRKNFRRVEGIGKIGKGSREWPLAALENFAALSSKSTRKFISRVPRLRCAKGYDVSLVPCRTRFETETSIPER